MFPKPLLHVWGWDINLYFIMIFVASFSSIFVAVRLCGKVLPEKSMAARVRTVVDGFTLLGLAGMVGARLFCFIGQAFENPKLLKTFSITTLLWGCIASLGGIAFAIAAGWLFTRTYSAIRGKGAFVFDALFPSLSLFQALARFGCFSAGCCHGRPAYGLPWAVTFSNPQAASIFIGIPVHPTQLYMIAGNLIIFCILLALFGRPLFRGTLVGVFLVTHGLLRFTVEFYRGDDRPMVGSLSLNQWVCLLFIGAGAIILAQRLRRQKRTVAV